MARSTGGPRTRASALLCGLLSLSPAASVFGLTSPASAAGPTLSNVRVSVLGATTATIAWDTDIASDTQVAYGPTAAYGSQTTLNTAMVTSHTANLTGLTANRTYHYQVRSRERRRRAHGLARPHLHHPARRHHRRRVDRLVQLQRHERHALHHRRGRQGRVDVGQRRRGRPLGRAAQLPARDLRRQRQRARHPGRHAARPGPWSPTRGTRSRSRATLAPSTSYFFAYNTNGASASVNNLRYSSGGISGWRTGGQPFGTWPPAFGAFSTQSATFSIYATFAQRRDAADRRAHRAGRRRDRDGRGAARGRRRRRLRRSPRCSSRSTAPTSARPDTTRRTPASWDTAGLLDGPARITAVATDTAGLTTTSSPVTVGRAQPGPRPDHLARRRRDVAGTSVTVVYAKRGDWMAGDGKHVHLHSTAAPRRWTSTPTATSPTPSPACPAVRTR